MKRNFGEEKTFIIAEAGVNHNGSLAIAKNLVEIAVEAGADAIKFQTYKSEELVSLDTPKATYQKKNDLDNQSQYEMLKSLELNEADQKDLQLFCKSKNILFLSTPFDLKSVHFLIHTLNLPIIKIASGEITNLPLIVEVARAGKPVILSTGMSRLGDIENALAVLAHGYLNPMENNYPSLRQCEMAYFSAKGRDVLQKNVSLLHCTSAYPAPFAEVNLRVIKMLSETFGLPVGYSDHTLGIAISIAAVACGAKLIEKHFTLDKKMAGPDHQASLEPDELSKMICSIREVEIALGHSRKIPTKAELNTRDVARKSLVATKNIEPNEIFTKDNIGCKRPGKGISPMYFENFEEKCALRHYKKDELIGS